MAISNMQQARQLRAGGGIMAIPRQKYGFGSFVKKAFKKVARPIKKIAKTKIIITKRGNTKRKRRAGNKGERMGQGMV